MQYKVEGTLLLSTIYCHRHCILFSMDNSTSFLVQLRASDRNSPSRLTRGVYSTLTIYLSNPIVSHLMHNLHPIYPWSRDAIITPSPRIRSLVTSSVISPKEMDSISSVQPS